MAEKIFKQPLVLLFRGSLCEMSRREFSGIMRYAHDAQWKVQTVEYASAAGNRFREIGNCDLDVARLLDFWKPLGCIVECSGEFGHHFQGSIFGTTPVVYLGQDPRLIPPSASFVNPPTHGPGLCAAKELLTNDSVRKAYLGG